MSSSEIAISVRGLSKCFEIYAHPRDRLKQFVLPRIQRALGKPPGRYFREFWALKNVSFEVRKGETIGIVGRNGSGKSTLLQMICGTLTPTHGSIEVRGRVAALLELGSGFNPEFTGRENVYLNAAVFGLTKPQIDARFDSIAAFADIGQFIEQPLKTYSSGMVLRLAFAVIAHVDADILVVDEALAVGDAFFSQKCMRFLRNFIKTGTVLFVSHDTGAVVNLCTSAVLLSKGEAIDIGSPKAITEAYLASLYASTQDVEGARSIDAASNAEPQARPIEYRDMREALINASTLRNDVEIFQFDAAQEGFGTGGAEVVSVRLLDQDSAPLSWLVGGEEVMLEVQCLARIKIQQPIVGFQFKDRLGQVVFADNTYLVYRHSPLAVRRGETLFARFAFRLPLLPSGDYSIDVAVADGTQENHVQLHWVHDGLILKVHASSACFGLVGIPMKQISLELR